MSMTTVPAAHLQEVRQVSRFLICIPYLWLIWATQEQSEKPSASSCRSGAVVDLVRSNGVKVPVALQISLRNDGDRIKHIVKVKSL